jgi:tryptophan synthase beta chain
MTSLIQAGEAEALLKATIAGELPDARGRFGPFGGRYVPETLVPAFERLEAGVREYLHDPAFRADYQRELREWVGRPTALTHAPRLSKRPRSG